MISFSSIRVFTTLNLFLFMFSYIDYIFDTDINFFKSTALILLKNYLFIDFIEYNLENKLSVDNIVRVIPQEQFYKEFDLYVISTSLMECFSVLLVKLYLIKNVPENLIQDIILFIPYSFCFEILFDLFHYITHYISHSRYIYKYIHKFHHYHKYPIPILTFYHHPLDVFLTNTVPIFLSIQCLSLIWSSPSLFTLKLLMAYKTFTEISGHTGKEPNGSSFVQFFWLPRLLNIELHTRDHDLHHTLNNCNYSKRFSLWDKLFGTFTSF